MNVKTSAELFDYAFFGFASRLKHMKWASAGIPLAVFPSPIGYKSWW